MQEYSFAVKEKQSASVKACSIWTVEYPNEYVQNLWVKEAKALKNSMNVNTMQYDVLVILFQTIFSHFQI